ncbi:helix-turn-helix transcriptional regulator [Mesorhizobium sp. B2-3-4]|uniref:helix-turn-helix transcriptional regulator n=1 Tax=Mesorhizobium sp. B2-3-4 TaxID=2589959 RepID=UPI00112A75C3|nr:helix-turn-helix transcriptional regulator [Mesorhizobium sp. B2-3-4]TPM30884.1 helix-turn-helix transcriptional regulator [Mesorhizobium sp. B2-3-4]
MIEGLVDRIYEAAFVPEIWPDVFDRLSDLSNSAGGGLGLFDERLEPTLIASELIQPVLEGIAAEGGFKTSSVTSLLMTLPPPPAFVYDADYFPSEALEANRTRLDRTRPMGIGGEIGTFIPLPTGELLLFVMERWLTNDRPSREELDRLNLMRPHLARSGLIGARLRLERARAATEALTTIGLPAAVMTSKGRVLSSNRLLEALPQVFVPTAFDGLAIADAEANRLFQQTTTYGTDVEMPVRSIPIPPGEDRDAMIVHIIPLRRLAHELFSGADMLIAATALNPTNLVPSPTVLTGLFDLTPAEARLAAALSAGDNLKAVAARTNITYSTARTYLERIFAKTGTHHQAQLVALLKGAQAPVNPSKGN